MKKLLVTCILFVGCKDAKTKIVDRQKEVLQEKSMNEKKLDAAQDSSMPSPTQLKEWDSLYKVNGALQKEYDSLQTELKKYK